MTEAAHRLLSTEIFMARGYGYLWTPKLLVLEAAASAVLALSFTTIAVTLLARRNVAASDAARAPLGALALCLLLAAVMHTFDLWLIWAPLYWLDGAIRGITAVVASSTAVAFLRLGYRDWRSARHRRHL